MILQESISTAIDAIRANLMRSLLTTIAIVIGTASVIAMVGIGSSAQRAIDDSITNLSARTLSVYPSRGRGVQTVNATPLVIKDADALIKDKEIAWRISPEIRGSKSLKYGNESISISVIGARENYLGIQGYEVEQGRFFSERDDLARKRVAIIGSSVSTELKTSSKALLGKDIDLGGVTFEIIGVMKSEGSSGWSNPDEQIYIPLFTASDRVFGRQRVDSIRVEVPNTYSPEEAMISIERVLRREHDIGPGEENNFRINDWSQFTDLQKQATAIFSALIIGIAGISLLVGGIGVMNIMLVSVTERTREIGLRKALGATHQAILLQFIIEAVALCIIGGVAGVILGSLLYLVIAVWQDWVFTIPFSAILGSVTFSACVGLFFGIWPARKAAQLEPAVALRYE
ncbi:MAG: ABC transporter permease [SAR86 cluster bacterium]|mgnify:FL=1|jgi:putative ABC transport system permease protein|nr:FtsX-like permease family protein [Pseudomonadota bacterium]MDA9023582.1 ABC transporter permease [Gammaproteobacteria bacterium]MDO7561509.1 ABC transporter permease [SAR86 cluster bacterium]MDA9027442.1 ABC transporter permease [Gammaproteobacteria bacterium]MDA9834803.1 ABC transporter permease [Gammaproteobacteria bacterium]